MPEKLVHAVNQSGDTLYVKTSTKLVYDETGKRLDLVLDTFRADVNEDVRLKLETQDQTIDGRLNVKADKAVEIPVTILASAWQGTAAPYTATIVVEGIASTSKGSINIARTATAEQRESARGANIAVIDQAENSITLASDGDKPVIDIPAIVTVLG